MYQVTVGIATTPQGINHHGNLPEASLWGPAVIKEGRSRMIMRNLK
jgi:hypothetical protein